MRRGISSEQLEALGYSELALYQKQAESEPRMVSGDSEKAEARSAKAPTELEPREELRRLLGSLVSPILRDAEGKLDTSKIQAENFEEFRQGLYDQVSVDGIAFNNSLLASYHRVLGKAEHEPLLRMLWDKNGAPNDGVSQVALRRFTADLIAVSAERFVASRLGDGEGRRCLRGILGDRESYSRELRTDLIKAIAAVGERQGVGGLYSHQSEKQISSWNYFNWGVNEAELGKAEHFAKEILSAADEQEAQIQKSQALYLDHPEKVRALATKARTVGPEEIRNFARIEEANRDKPDPVSQLRIRLARLWLLAADSENWREENAYASRDSRAYLLAESERLLSLTDNVRDEAGLRWLNERVQDFLAAPLPAKAGSESGALQEAWRWLEHKAVGNGLEELFEVVPEGRKASYLELKQLSDTWKYAAEMGEALYFEPEPAGPEAPLARAVAHLSSELRKSKQQFWYSYKQHKALSRGVSNVASWFGGGDIEDIREANHWIDSALNRLAKVATPEELKAELNGLHRELKKGGKIFAAMEAAEMEGIEQLVGLLQTVAEIAAITLVTEGMGTAGALANAARAGRAMQGAVEAGVAARRLAQGAQAASWVTKAEYGMKMGMTISATENAVAVGTGEVRERPETLLAWGKDSLATGAAMSLFGPLSMGGGSVHVSRNLGKDLLRRYVGQGAKGLGHLAKDTAAETGEELFDAHLRQGLDGKQGALSADQIREITLVSGFGGAQMGALGHGFRRFQQRTESSVETLQSSRSAAAPAATSFRGNIFLSPVWMFLGAGGPGGIPPGPGEKSGGHAQRLAALHAQLEKTYAEAGQTLTLRDLLLAGQVTGEMSLKLKVLSMEEGLRIVYADRFAEGESSEAIKKIIREGVEKEGSKDETSQELRRRVRTILNEEGATSLREIYEELAASEGMALDVYLGRVLRDVENQDEFDKLLVLAPFNSSFIFQFIEENKLTKALNHVLRALKDSHTASSAAGALGNLGIRSKAVESALVELLNDNDVDARHAAAEALAKLGIGSEAVERFLVRELSDRHWWERRNAVMTIMSSGFHSEAVEQALQKKLKDRSRRVRTLAAWALGSLGVQSETVERVLVEGLGSAEIWDSWCDGERGHAVNALRRLGMRGDAVERALVGLLKNGKNIHALLETAGAMGHLGIQRWSVERAVLDWLNHDNSRIRMWAAWSAADLGFRSKAVDRALVKLSEDEDAGVRLRAAQSLGNLGHRHEALPALVALLNDPESWVRRNAAQILGNFGVQNEAVERALVERLKDGHDTARKGLLSSLDQLFPHWDKKIRAEFPLIKRILDEELGKKSPEAAESAMLSLEDLMGRIPSWSSTENTLSTHVPAPEKLVFVPATVKALQGLTAGILTHTPVYLIGETGTGKNAMLRYLAHRTGTPLLRINFSRETDDSQLFGHFEIEPDEQGQRRVVVRDGKMIQAMKHGAWMLWDEANLASESFLVAQNDLIQQLMTGKVTVRQGGKLVTIDVHPHFRLFATGNPEGYAGRKVTERSFGNRWLKLFVQPMNVEEQQAFLATEYQNLSPQNAELIPSVLHALKVALGPEKITIRTLKRVASRIEAMEPAGMRAHVTAIEAEILDGLNPEEYAQALQALALALPLNGQNLEEFFSQAPSREEFEAEVGEYSGLLDRDGRGGQKEKQKEDEPKNPEAGADWGEYVPVSTFLKYAAKVLESLIRGDHLLIEGPPATAKSSFMKLIGRLAGQKVIEATGTSDHSTAEMIGMPTLDEAGNLIFQDGYFLKALKEGAILVVNEANLIPAEVLERLNSLFDDDRMIVVSEDGHEAPVKAHPDFRLVLTQNPAGMNGGRKRHSPALENKFRKIFVRDNFKPEELSEILREQFPDLKVAASVMAEFHVQAASLLIPENLILTLRDLRHWSLISSALMAHEAAGPAAAMVLGARLAYGGRFEESGEGFAAALHSLQERLGAKRFDPSEASDSALWRIKLRELLNNPQISSQWDIWRQIIPENLNILEYFGEVLPHFESEEDILAIWNLLPQLIEWYNGLDSELEAPELLSLLDTLTFVAKKSNLGPVIQGHLTKFLEGSLSGKLLNPDPYFFEWVLKSIKCLNPTNSTLKAAQAAISKCLLNIDVAATADLVAATHFLNLWDEDLGSQWIDLYNGEVKSDILDNSQAICFVALLLWSRGVSLEEIRPRLPSWDRVAAGFGEEYPFADESALDTSCLLGLLDRMGASSDKMEIIASLWELVPEESGEMREECLDLISRWVRNYHIWSPELENRLKARVDEATWLNFKRDVDKMDPLSQDSPDGQFGFDFYPNLLALFDGTWSPELEFSELPQGDKKLAEEFSIVRKILLEELSRKQSDVAEEKSVEFQTLATGLPKWSAPDAAQKARLLEYIPGVEKLFMAGSTAEALQGLIGGIMAQLPVYLIGETGTGKNAMLRHLAHLTGTPLLRINFNRETDESQLFGHFEVERDAQGKRRVVVRDGKMIQAMKQGAWMLWDEANLASEAFLVAQNDLIQQIKTGKVTVRQGGKLVTIDVHPHFRLFATGNPEGYAGRKATERSFGNRWLKLFMKPMSVEEQQAFLATEYKNLSPENTERIPSVLHALKLVLGAEKVTIRTLKRVAGRIEALEPAGVQAYVAAIEAEILDGLNSEEYDRAVQALALALSPGEGLVSDHLNRAIMDEDFFAEVEKYRESLQTKSILHNAHWEDLVPVPTTVKYAHKVLDSFKRGDQVLIEGPPALSKSAIPKWLGKLLQQAVIEVTGSPDHSASEMIGMPTIDESGDLVFQEGYFLKALKEGAILVVNEANLIPAEVLERLNSVFDDDKAIVVSENGHDAPVKAHPDFRLVLTQNPAGMNGGRKRHSPALENKFRKIYIRDGFAQEELVAIARENFPGLAPAAESMVGFHQDAVQHFAAEGDSLTLRDLLHWGLIASRLIHTAALPPGEALPLGAALVYLQRDANREGQDRLQERLAQLGLEAGRTEFPREDPNPDPESDALRIMVRKALRGGDITSIRDLFESLSAHEGMSLDVWLGFILRGLSKEPFDWILDHAGSAEWKETDLIRAAANPAGRDRLMKMIQDPLGSASARGILVELGLVDEEVKKALLEGVQDMGPDIRSDSLAALSRLGLADEEMKPTLLKGMEDRDINVRRIAAEALGRLGQADEKVRQALLKGLADESPIVVKDAAEALGKLGLADEEAKWALLEQIREMDWEEDLSMGEIVLEALDHLGLADEGAEGVLLKGLKDGDNVRGIVAKALGEWGAVEKEVKQALLEGFKALKDNRRLGVGLVSLRALGKVDQADEEVKSELLAAFWDRGCVWRDRVVELLAKLVPADEELRQVLLVALRDEYSLVRAAAAKALGKMGAADAEVKRGLLQALRDREPDVGENAVEALDKLGLVDEELRLECLAALATENAFNARFPTKILDQYFPSWDREIRLRFRKFQEVLFEELARPLGEVDESQRALAEKLLESLPRWEGASDPFRQVIRDRLQKIEEDPEAVHLDPIYQYMAQQSGLNLNLWLSRVLRGLSPEEFQEIIGTIGGEIYPRIEWLSHSKNPAAADRLLELLDDEGFAAYAIDGLGRLGATGENIKRALSEKLRVDENPTLRMSAAAALGKLRSADEFVLKSLRSALNDEAVGVRMASAEALVELGFADDAVREVFLAVLEDPREDDWDFDPTPTTHEIALQLDAAEALVAGGASDESVAFLLKLFQDAPEGSWEKARAAGALIRWRGGDETLERWLLEKLSTKDGDNPFIDVENALTAASTLAGLGPHREDVKRALFRLSEDHPWVRARAGIALASLGESGEAVKSMLLEALREGAAVTAFVGETAWATAEALDRSFPGWDRKLQSDFETFRKILAEEMSRRLADAAGAKKNKLETLLKALPRWQADSSQAPTPLRQTIRNLLKDPEVHDAAQIHRRLAKEKQVSLPVWMGYFLKEASQEELDTFLDNWPDDLPPWPEEWIGRMGLTQGIPYLIRSFHTKGAEHRERRLDAVMALERLGIANSQVEEVLIQAVKQPSKEMRLLALRAIRKLGLDSPAIQAALEALFTAYHPAVRREVAETWAALNLPVSARLLKTLGDLAVWPGGVLGKRIDAARALEALRRPGSVEILRRMMGDLEDLAQIAAAESLGKMGIDLQKVREHLLKHLTGDSPESRIAAAQAIARLRWEGEDFEKALISRIRSRGQGERIAMIAALGVAQNPGPEVRPALLEALRKDRYFDVRLAAAEAMGLIAQPIPEVEDFFESTLLYRGVGERLMAWRAIRSLAWRSPRLESLLLESRIAYPMDRKEAMKSLVELGIRSEAVKQALIDELKEENGSISFAAMHALNQLFPAWDEELKSDMPRIREIIAVELSRKQSDVAEEKSVEFQTLATGLSKWSPPGGVLEARLQEYIPGVEKLFMAGSTVETLQGLIGGIMAKLPVYLIGETGTGKNAMLRHLAHLTGTPLLRINFNRETDESQLFGHFEVERDAQGKRRVVVRDGKMIQAMKQGAWMLWDEANLASEAFLVAQNDLIQQIKTGKVTVRQGGKLVTIDVHLHFRLFATGNPEGYAGRKATERSFGNRWLKLFVKPMSVEEQQAFLATEYKSLSPENAERIPSVLHALKLVLGAEKVTIRTLKRVAGRIAAVEPAGRRAYVTAIEAEILDGLNPEEYDRAVQALALALPGDGLISDYLNRAIQAETFFSEAEKYRESLQARSLSHSAHWEDLVPVPTTVKYAQKVLDSFKRGDQVLIEGPPALSKSAIPKWLGKLLQQPVIEVTGSPDHSASEMIGMPTLDEQGNLVFQEGYFLKALKEGVILVVNEANLIPAEVLERLNSVFDDDKSIVVSESGHEAPVKAHPDFRLVLTQNPAGMNGGRKRHSPALENKFRKIYFRDAFSQEELEAILGKKPSGGAGSSGESGSFRALLRHLPFSVHPHPAGASPATGAARWFFHSIFAKKGRWKPAAEAPRLPPAEEAALKAKAEEAEHGIKTRIDAFMNEHGGTLENLGSLAAMRRIQVHIDTSAEVDVAALDLESGILLVNPLAARELSPGQIAAVALHEGGHAAISRIGDGFFFEKRSRHFLANCLEDPRVNEYELARLPGARGDFASLYEKYFPKSKGAGSSERGVLPPLGDLPHEQFALGFLELWANGGVEGRIEDPELREAIAALEPEVRKIWQTLPNLYQPREREVLARQNEAYAIIRDRILPVYERFYAKSLEELERRLVADERVGFGGGGGSGGRVRGVDAEDLSAKAREILERRSGELAERLEPKDSTGRRRESVDRIRRRDSATRAGDSPTPKPDFKPYAEKTMADRLKERAQRKAEREAFHERHTWRRYFDPIAPVARETAELLRQVLQLDSDFEYQGPYLSGPKLDVRKAVETILRNEAGIFSEEDLKLFQRKRFPTRRSHRFVLVLDASGSMKDEAQAPALQAVSLFLSVLEGLRVGHAVVGFSDIPDLHKGFDEKLPTEEAKDALLQELESAGGGGTNDLAGIELAAELLEGQDAEEKTILVVTDGQGVDTTGNYVKKLEARGVKVIGIGIGPGTEHVGQVYGDHYQRPDFRMLPKTLLRILAKRMMGS